MLTEEVEGGGTGFTLGAFWPALAAQPFKEVSLRSFMVIIEPDLIGGLSVLADNRQHNIAAIGQEYGVGVDAQHLVGLFLCNITCIIFKDAHRNFSVLDDGIKPRHIARMFGIEGIRHTQ